jgi:hypothetical protein
VPVSCLLSVSLNVRIDNLQFENKVLSSTLTFFFSYQENVFLLARLKAKKCISFSVVILLLSNFVQISYDLRRRFNGFIAFNI